MEETQIDLATAQEAILKDKQEREMNFKCEYDVMLKELCEKYKCNLQISQPQLLISAL